VQLPQPQNFGQLAVIVVFLVCVGWLFFKITGLR
jgi:hypothetical protein